MEAVELGNDDRPADAPRLSGVHDWKVGKLKLQRRRYQQSTACSLRRPAWVVCVWSCEGLRFPDPDTTNTHTHTQTRDAGQLHLLHFAALVMST